VKAPQWTAYHWVAIAGCLLVFVAAGLVADQVLERVPHLEDEVAYLFQAEVFASGEAFAATPSRPRCFFAPFVVDYEGRRFGKYPPGWPALLSLGVRLGQRWWVNAIGAALTVSLVFRLAHDLYSPQIGGLASALAATSPFVLLLAGSLMSHTWCLVFATAFLWSVCQARFRQRRQTLWMIVAGVALGAAFVIRPFTAIAFALPTAIWAARRLARRGDWRVVWSLGVGFVPLALIVPVFNALWTGDPLTFPYVLFWPYDRLGFGPGTGPLPGGNTVWLGLSEAAVTLGHLANDLHGWPTQSLTFVVLGFVLGPRLERDRFLGASALSLILGYVLYWTSGDVFGPRYAYEASSALFVLSATGIVRVADWARRRGFAWGLRLTIGLLCIVYGAFYLPAQFQRYHGLYGISGRTREILKKADLENAVVFVREHRGWWDYAVPFSLNAPDLDSDVVYVSDCERYHRELVAEYAGRRAYYFDGEVVSPYAPGADP
jgi:4-amino-4-deoxy-L-arabinose transferase-like glycosyltransferase